MEPEEMAVAQKDRPLLHRRGSSILKDMYAWGRTQNFYMDLEETEAGNDCAGEG
jgi:hypothetical protein